MKNLQNNYIIASVKPWDINNARKFAAKHSGKTIIMISSEYEELLSICSRIYVMREGRIVAEYPVESANEENLIYSATVSH